MTNPWDTPESNSGNSWRSNNQNDKKNWKKKEDTYDGNIALYKPYLGTGNRDTPDDILKLMFTLASELEQVGFTLRAGASCKADLAFEAGSKTKEIVLPWKGFESKESTNYFNTRQALDMAKLFHPTFDGLKDVIKAFLGRNARIVLGKDLKSPVMFVILWSEDGAENSKTKSIKTGSMGHIIAMADAMKIPVFNLANKDAEQRLKQHLGLPSTNPFKTANEHGKRTEEPEDLF